MTPAGCSSKHDLAADIATAQRFAEAAVEATRRRGMPAETAKAVTDVACTLGAVAGSLLGAAEALRLMVAESMRPEQANAAWLLGLLEDHLGHQSERLNALEAQLLALVAVGEPAEVTP